MIAMDEFSAPRPCFLAPISELGEAADLLSQAADSLLAGDTAHARDYLQRADMPAVRAFAARVMCSIDPEIHRYRDVADLPAALDLADRAKARRPTSATEMAVFARDGYRCRYCGCRVVLAKARRVMSAMVPDALPWGAADKDKHAAFYALTAVADHVVPHARGGTSEPGNLVTTCQPCNYGKGDWLIEQVGLIDPLTRPPICDAWDGLTRMPAYGTKTQKVAHGSIGGSKPRRDDSGTRTPREPPPARRMLRDAWFSEFDRWSAGLSTRLLGFLEGCQDIGVTWKLHAVLIVQMSAGREALAILGITPDGGVEIPWDIAGYKQKFRPFAEAVAAAIPGAVAYETPKMWRVRKDGHNVTVTDLLEVAPILRAALANLHAALTD